MASEYIRARGRAGVEKYLRRRYFPFDKKRMRACVRVRLYGQERMYRTKKDFNLSAVLAESRFERWRNKHIRWCWIEEWLRPKVEERKDCLGATVTMSKPTS